MSQHFRCEVIIDWIVAALGRTDQGAHKVDLIAQ